MNRSQEQTLKTELYRRLGTDSAFAELFQANSMDGLEYSSFDDPPEVWLSPRCKELLGYSEGQVPDCPDWWQAFVFQEDLEATLKSRLQPSPPMDQLARYRHRDGSTVWLRTRSLAIRDEQGKPVRVLRVHSDLTATKENEERARLGTIIDSLGEGLLIVNEHGKTIHGNQAALRMHGLIAGQQDLLDLPHCQEYFQLSRLDGTPLTTEEWPVARILRGEPLKAVHLRIQRREVAQDWERFFSYSGSLARDPDGNSVAYLLIDDVTEIKRSDADRRHMEAQMRQMEKMEAIGQLSGGMAHEFNNLLAVILGNLELARADLPDGHPVHHNLEEIFQAGAHAKGLVQQILAFSNKQHQERCPLSPVAAVRESADLLRAVLPSGVKLVVTLAKEVPKISTGAIPLQQAILNLGSNAWQSLEGRPGQIEVELAPIHVDEALARRVSGLRLGSYVRLRVTDNGKGMDEGTLGRIFEPFFTTRGPGQGTGLGLSVVHGIVQRHGGAIQVVSEVGEGSTFTLYFPACDAESEAPRPDRPTGGQHILFIDDEKSLVTVSSRLLQKHGYQVSGFTSPSEAVRVFLENPADFDVVITDLNMPVLSGLQVAESILEARPDIKIVLHSGYLTDELTESAQRIGIHHVLCKPSSSTQMIQVLRQLAL